MNVTTTGSRILIEMFHIKAFFIAGANYEHTKNTQNRRDLVETLKRKKISFYE